MPKLPHGSTRPSIYGLSKRPRRPRARLSPRGLASGPFPSRAKPLIPPHPTTVRSDRRHLVGCSLETRFLPLLDLIGQPLETGSHQKQPLTYIRISRLLREPSQPRGSAQVFPHHPRRIFRHCQYLSGYSARNAWLIVRVPND